MSKGIKANQEMNGLLEFVRLEYCSSGVMKGLFDMFSEHFYEINSSMWASIRGRLVLPDISRNQFPSSMKKREAV
jgi:hypothetical protein